MRPTYEKRYFEYFDVVPFTERSVAEAAFFGARPLVGSVRFISFGTVVRVDSGDINDDICHII